MKVGIIGASGKLGQYMVQHALDRGYEVVGVCRKNSVKKLDRFEGRITIVPGATNDPEVIRLRRRSAWPLLVEDETGRVVGRIDEAQLHDGLLNRRHRAPAGEAAHRVVKLGA